MKKTLAILLAALLLVSLTACGGGTTTSTPTDSAPDSTPASNPASGDPVSEPAGEFELPGSYDFGGEELIIKNFGGRYGFQKPGGGEISDMEIRWKSAVEEAYHCKLVLETLIPNDTQNSLVTRILAGEKVADVIACHRLDVEKMRISGSLLKDLASQEIKDLGLDLTDPIWNATLTDALTYNGKTYGTYPSRPDIECGCLCFNKDMLNQLGLPDPYQYVATKEWTYDKFIEYCQAATKNGNYGFAYDNDSLMTLFHNNGGMQNISKLPDGRMQYTAYNAENVATISYLKEKLVDAKLTPPETGILDLHNMFKEGKLLFMSGPDTYYWAEDKWGSCDFDVGFLPMPIGPNGDDYSYVLRQWPICFCISATNDDPEMAVAFLNAYLAYEKVSAPLREQIIRDDWFGNDEQGYEVYQMLRTKEYYDWDIYDLGFLDIMYQPTAVFIHTEESVQATMESNATRFEKMVDDIYNKNYNP